MSTFRASLLGGIRYPVFGGAPLQLPLEVQQFKSFREKVQWIVAYRGVDGRFYIPTDPSATNPVSLFNNSIRFSRADSPV